MKIYPDSLQIEKSFEKFLLLSVNIRKIIYKRFFFRFSLFFFLPDNVNSNNNVKYFSSFFVCLNQRQKAVGRDGEASAFMVYHESVKHIIPLYEIFFFSEETEKESAASHNKRVSNVPHTIFCSRPPKKHFSYGEGGRETEKAYFIGDRKKIRGFLPFLTKHILLLPPPSSLSISASRKKRRNDIKMKFSMLRIYYDLTMRCRNVSGWRMYHCTTPQFRTEEVSGRKVMLMYYASSILNK